MKKTFIPFLFISVIAMSGCATSSPQTVEDEQEEVPEELLRVIKINKLYMCHYFFAVAENSAKGEQKEKLRRIALSLKYQATKLATESGGPDLVKKATRSSKVGFKKFMDRMSEIESRTERNKAFKKFSVSCAATAGAKLRK